RDEFIEQVRQDCGIGISVLSGDDEAELTYVGATSEFLTGSSENPMAVLDIGGGSTELTTGVSGNVTSKTSLDLGSVRLTERILRSSPPSMAALEEAQAEVSSWTSKLPRLPAHTRLIGVAGTVTTLAAIDLKLLQYDRTRVSGYKLTLRSIDKTWDELRSRTVPEIMRDFPQIEAGRADIIVAGIMILRGAMGVLDADDITVSDRGLRYGLALREYSKRR
ncbi:MAG TPA: Ppx/GppA family phosphatase, partial [Bacteroidota bacterium]|nr:Ppx/GppA family phosphatase [Bacteroidota bacterium]